MILYFLTSCVIFILFSVILFLFGYTIRSLLFNKLKPIKLNLKEFLISYGIGTTFFISYSFILINIRFFTILTTIGIPLIVIFSYFSIYLLLDIKTIKNNIKKVKPLQSFKKKQFYHFSVNLTLCIVSIIINLSLLLSIISQGIGYPGRDPYTWFQAIYFTQRYGYTSIDYISSVYSQGYTIFSCGFLFFSNDYYSIFFFIKYLPIFLSIINIMSLYVIAKSIFKNKLLIFFSLLLYSCFTYLTYRYTSAFSSNLATMLGLIYFLILKKNWIFDSKYNDLKFRQYFLYSLYKNDSIIKGVLLAGIYLANPIYGIFVIIFNFLFEFFYLLIVINKKEIFKIVPFVLNLISILLYFLVIIFPYLITQPSETNLLVQIYNLFFYSSILHINLELFTIILLFLIPIGDNYFFNHYGRLEFLDFYFLTFGFGFILILMSLAIKYKNVQDARKSSNHVLLIAKGSLIFVIVAYFFHYVVQYLSGYNLKFIPLYRMLSIFTLRLIEIFGALWILLFVFSFSFLFASMTKYVNKLHLKGRIKSHSAFKLKKIKIAAIFLTITICFINNIDYQQYPVYKNYFEDSKVEAVLFIGNYFAEEEPEENTVILLQDDYIIIYYLLDSTYLNKSYYFFNLTEGIYYDVHYYSLFNRYYVPYNSLSNFIGNISFSYVFYNINDLNNELYTYFTQNFSVIYENSGGYIFSRLNL